MFEAKVTGVVLVVDKTSGSGVPLSRIGFATLQSKEGCLFAKTEVGQVKEGQTVMVELLPSLGEVEIIGG